MKDIKDYLHLYLGQPCIHDAGKIGTLAMIRKDYCGIDVGSASGSLLKSEFKLKLILRSLSDITIEEAWEMVGLNIKDIYDNVELKVTKTGIDIWYELPEGGSGSHEYDFSRLPTEKFMFLLSKGFDLFGLIEEGLAIKKGG